MGFALDQLGPELKLNVEDQLFEDLKQYCELDKVKIDWSETVVEGHHALFMDGSIENWSSVIVTNFDGEPIGEGWIDFILLDNSTFPDPVFIVYWDLLEIENRELKKEFGVPTHVIRKLPTEAKTQYEFTKGYFSKDQNIKKWLAE